MPLRSLSPEQRSLLKLAIGVWRDRGQAKQTGRPWSEPTITETFFRDLDASYPGRIDIEIFNARQEGRNGSDWAWAFLSKDGQLNTAMLVQAKKLDNYDTDYPELGHRIGRRKKGPDLRKWQIDVLMKSADELGIPAVYAFYNHLDDETRVPAHCHSIAHPVESWGISLAAANKVKAIFDDYSFESHKLHSIPLHCLLCTNGEGHLGPSGSPNSVAAALNRLLSEEPAFPGGLPEDPKQVVLPTDRLNPLFSSVLRKSDPNRPAKMRLLANRHPNLAGVVVVQDTDDPKVD